MQRIHHPSPSQVPIIHLLGDRSDFCVAKPGCTGLSAALADRSRKGFSIPQCEILLFGKGEWVQCLLLQMPCWREKGVFERDRGAPPHIAVLICSPPHPGADLIFSVGGACMCFHHTVEAHLCDGEF